MIERGGDEWQRRMDAMHERMEKHIAEFGQSVMGVGGDVDNLPFCYTIGLHMAGLPELLLFTSYNLNDVLNLLADKMREEGVFPDGQPVDIGGKFPTVAVHCDSPDAWDEYTYQAAVHYGHRDYRVIQLVVPDTAGRFPWDPGCVDSWARQPILGRTPTYSGRPQ